jgi:hypothetical protein
MAVEFADTTGNGFTVTVVVAAFMQEFISVAVMVYIVVTSGVAITGLPVELFRDEAGDQV